MADTTLISWADRTHNHWVGCQKVGPACDHCYAENLMQNRFGRVEFGGPGKGVGTRSLTSAANRKKPYAWDRQAAKDGTRPFVFCSSLSDVFDSAVPLEWQTELFTMIAGTPHLVWLLLTKRPGNIVRLWRAAMPGVAFPKNVAIGATIVTQAEADRDIPKLLDAKARLDASLAFLSMEPLLEKVDLSHHLYAPCPNSLDGLMMDPSTGVYECCSKCDFSGFSDEIAVDWIITGGETDQGAPNARPTHPDWVRGLRDQCAAVGVAFHHKQNGEWDGETFGAPGIPGATSDWATIAGRKYGPDEVHSWPDGSASVKVGKARSGRTLDGQTHDARPTPPPLEIAA